MYAKVKTSILILFILLSALLWAAKPALRPCSGCTQAMKRESRIQPATLDEALSISLAIGDGRQVDFAPFGLSWEV